MSAPINEAGPAFWMLAIDAEDWQHRTQEPESGADEPVAELLVSFDRPDSGADHALFERLQPGDLVIGFDRGIARAATCEFEVAAPLQWRKTKVPQQYISLRLGLVYPTAVKQEEVLSVVGDLLYSEGSERRLFEIGAEHFEAIRQLGLQERSSAGAENADSTPEPQLAKDLSNRLHSDDFNLADEDVLGYDLHASNLYHILTDSKTNPPLNVGILAPWGRGKTSLMRKVEHMFRQRREQQTGGTAMGDKNRKAALPGLAELRAWLANEDLFPVQKIPFATVWFNPWNYQSSDAIWAGMANAIIEQVVEQLPDAATREAFWFRLNLDRIDKAALRRDLHLRGLLFTTQFLIWGLAIVASMVVWIVSGRNGGLTAGIAGIGAMLGVFSSVASKLKPVSQTIQDAFEKYIKPPQYLGKLGTFHEVQEDLKLVFELLIDKSQPLTVFVDDLDRCSPSKVVEVVEAINVFISGDHRHKCYFVLGMDAEIVAASLDVAYEKMKGKVAEREAQQGSLGWYFLDKFIQLPFFIPVLNDRKKLEYLKHLLQTEVIDTEGDSPDPGARSKADSELADLARQVLKAPSPAASQNIIQQQGLSRADELALDKAILKKQIEDNKDREEISEQVSRFSKYLNADPRTLKRFANLLRFYNSYQVLRMKKGQSYVPIQYLGKYLALMLRFPQLARWLQWEGETGGGLPFDTDTKAGLIDSAIAALHALETGHHDGWLSQSDIKALTTELPWIKSRRLLDILLSEKSAAAGLKAALDCNVW